MTIKDQDDKTMTENPYGYCPLCGVPGMQRERRFDGNDKCENGHEYPSAKSLKAKPAFNCTCKCHSRDVVEVQHAAE